MKERYLMVLDRLGFEERVRELWPDVAGWGDVDAQFLECIATAPVPATIVLVVE